MRKASPNTIDQLRILMVMSWRNIHRQKRRSLLVIAAATAGMLGVVMNLGLINGLGKMWVEGGIESGLGHVQIRPTGYAKTLKINARFEDAATITSQVAATVREAQLQAQHSFRFERAGFMRLGSTMQGVQLIGIDPELEKGISKFDEWIIRGNYLTPADEQDRNYGIIPILIGKANAEKFEVEVGDTVVISIGTIDSSTRSVRARIQGVYQSIAEPVDKYTAMVYRSDLAKIYSDNDDEQLSYAIFLGEDRKDADLLKQKLQNAAPGLSADFMTYRELQPRITYLMETWDSLVFVLYIIMLLGFSLVLLNSVLMSVFERTQEIGFLRALGSSGRLVFLMVVFESALLGLLGCSVGLAIGGGIIGILGQTGFSFTMFEKGMELLEGAGTLMYPVLTWRDVFVGLASGLLISLLAAIYPAYKAVRLTPISAIHDQ